MKWLREWVFNRILKRILFQISSFSYVRNILTCLFAIALFLKAFSSNAQLIPYGLQLRKVQSDIIKKTTKFDSLILIDKSSYWDDDLKIYGLGFKQKDLYQITLYFKKGKSSFYDIKISKMKFFKVIDDLKINEAREMDFLRISKLSKDSLNLKSRTKEITQISDSDEWTILVVKMGVLTLKQSYEPAFYQKRAFTIEREYFINSILAIEKLLELSPLD